MANGIARNKARNDNVLHIHNVIVIYEGREKTAAVVVVVQSI